MRAKGVPGTLALLLAVVAPAAADPPRLVPTNHQDAAGMLDELADHLRSLGQRWRGSVTEEEPFSQPPIISIMLSHRHELRLTTAQVTELERLRTDFQRQAIKRDADLRVQEMDVATLLKSDPVDLGSVEAKIREIVRTRGDLRIARVRAIEQAKAQLTADQRAKLASLLADPWAPYSWWWIPPARPAPPPP